MTRDESTELAEHFFRHSYAKMVAVLVRYFGLKQVELAEDIAQDTLVEAMDKWSIRSIPENPEAWLMDVAKKKTINHLRRTQILQEKVLPNLAFDKISQENELKAKDSTLRMIFTCCHPDLPVESQVSLALKTLCGLSIPEIAHSLLTTESTINKRLYRAKQKFRDGSIDFDLPNERVLNERLDAVFSTLYVLFNEGYYSTHHEQVIRMDLCFESIRLTEEVLECYPESEKAKALLALMYLAVARFESRIDIQGALVILLEQDRGKWDLDLISIGMKFLNEAALGNEVSIYHLLAGISAEHCIASDFASTNWDSIHKQYSLLEKIQPSALVLFNKAIAKFYGISREEALEDLLKLQSEEFLMNNSHYHAAVANFYMDMNQKSKALPYYKQALKLSNSSIEKDLIQKQMMN